MVKIRDGQVGNQPFYGAIGVDLGRDLWPYSLTRLTAMMGRIWRGGAVMQWDLGFQGMALLGAISLGFGLVSALLVGRGWAHRLWALAITTVACFGAGLLTSEWLFGWATEADLQPNVDGLSRDEVLLSSSLTTAVVVLAMRYLTRRSHGVPHLWGRTGRPSGHA